MLPPAHAHRFLSVKLNAVLGRTPCEWMPNSAALLCKTVPAGRGPVPKPSDVPTGPHVTENLGEVTPAPTYEDMLETPDDERIFGVLRHLAARVRPAHRRGA